MAQAFSKQQIIQLPVIPYEKIRTHLKTGDIVFCSGSYTFPALYKVLPKVCGAM